MPFDVAAVLPSYLEAAARDYFSTLGCVHFSTVGVVNGAPNVTVIFDATEVADQGYETLLRDEKIVTLSDGELLFEPGADVLVFPGSYDLIQLCDRLPPDSAIHIDVAYDVANPSLLAPLVGRVETVLLSTSSALFADASDRTPEGLLAAFGVTGPRRVARWDC